jgi:hypothetical protein
MDVPASPTSTTVTQPPGAEPPPPTTPAKRNGALRKWVMTAVRWTIAIVGAWWVISQMSFADKVLVATPTGAQQMTLAGHDATDDDATFRVIGRAQPIPRSDVLSRPAKKNEKVTLANGATVTLLGIDLESSGHEPPHAQRLYVQPRTGGPRWVTQPELAKPYEVKVPYPRVDVGINRLVRQAGQKNLWLLILAIAIFPITFALTAVRWHELLKALDIHITLAMTFALNMVGAFYNTFMPGSTGGDVLKALYVSRHTTHRTRAVMSVLIDRIIGLIALIIIGSIAATSQWHVPQCRHIAIVTYLILGGIALGLLIFYQPTLHRLFLIDWILNHLPMQKQVQNAVKVMEIYRQRPGLVLLAVCVTFPVHMAVICSAMFAGKAFELPLPALYYWAIVPVIVLVGSIPISPQGAGVMEYFAIKLTETRGATVSQAFALTMSIRLVQILWNLTGAYYVLRGHFHKPTEADEQEFQADLAGGPEPEPA